MFEFEKEELLVRAEQIGNYIVDNKSTVRQAAEKFGISKTTVHLDVTKRLREQNIELYERVREVLDYNTSQRSIRGGIATKAMFKK